MKSETDLTDGLEILRYEEEMLHETFKELALVHPVNVPEIMDSSGVSVEYSHPYFRGYSQHIHKAILESFLIHVRIFIEFLYDKRKHGTRDTDILAEDYFDTPAKWHEIIGDKPIEFGNTKDNLDKYLAHISMIRKRSELDKQWNCSKLYEWITSGLKLFREKRAG